MGTTFSIPQKPKFHNTSTLEIHVANLIIFQKYEYSIIFSINIRVYENNSNGFGVFLIFFNFNILNFTTVQFLAHGIF